MDYRDYRIERLARIIAISYDEDPDGLISYLGEKGPIWEGYIVAARIFILLYEEMKKIEAEEAAR